MEVAEKIFKYLNSPGVAGLAQASQNAYSYSLGHLQSFCAAEGIKSLADFQPQAFTEWLKGTRQLTDQSVAQHFRNVKIFLRWAGIPTDFTYKISNHDKQAWKRKHSKRWFTDEDIEKCLEYPFDRKRDRLIVRLLIETGCRARELAALEASDVDLENRTIYLGTSKTEPRIAFFSPDTKKLLEGMTLEGTIFPSVGRIKQIVNKMLIDLGLKSGKDGRGCHAFRHYFASKLFFSGGMRIEEVALLMGDTVRTVQDVYLHCPEKILKDSISKAWGWKGGTS